MKVKLLLIMLCMAAFQANAQMQNVNDAVQITTDFDQKMGVLTFWADNRDYCTYYVVLDLSTLQGFLRMGSGYTGAVGHGRRQLCSLKIDPSGSGYSINYRFSLYRGSISVKPNIDFSCSLPCALTETALVKVDENREGYQLVFELTSDTVYACRGGVACDDDLKDYTAKGYRSFSDSRLFSQITLYHKDGTFGEYIFSGKALVMAGENVKMGQAIAVLDRNLNENMVKIHGNTVKFSIYFLDKNKVKEKNIGNKHTHFRPFFQTDGEGKVRLEANKTYICERTDEMLMQDMSKREKKKFLENKKNNEK
jgi:hypothetical protein